MRSKSLKIKQRDLVLFFIVFIFLLLSGSAVGLAYTSLFDPIFLVVTAFLFFFDRRHRNYSTSQLLVATVLLLFYITNLFIHMGTGVNERAYISYMMRIVAGFFFCCSMKEEEFEKSYLGVMFVIAAYSLIMFMISQTAGMIGGVRTPGKYPIHILYNYNGYLLHRNSGIFWEPGAYQLFLNIALLYNFKRNNYVLRRCINLSSILFAVSLLTTRSTTGYFAFAVVMIYLIYKNWKHFSNRQKILTIIPLIMVVAYFIYRVASSSVVIDKFFGRGRSYRVRRNDFFSSIRAIREHLFIGYGIGTIQYQAMSMALGITSNSVGVFVAAIYFGVLYALYYSYRLFKYVFVNQKGQLIVFLTVLVLSMLSEDFFRYAIYFVFAIGFGDKKHEKDGQENNI